MKACDRFAAIERIVGVAGTMSFADLKKHFPDISDMTLRRDLDRLDKEHRIVRVHGGVRSIVNSAGVEANYLRRVSLNPESKQAIAAKAAGLLRPNTAVFLDGGTTATELCKFIPNESIRIYSCGIPCILELKNLSKVDAHIVGGRFDPASLCSSGPEALANIGKIHFDMAFLGTIGYDFFYGFTCEKAEDAQIKSEAIRRSDRCVVLMDSSKLGHASTYTFAKAGEVDAVITEGELDGETVRHFTEAGMQVL